MARAKQGILDGPSGTVGPTVWCHGKKRRAYVRAKPLGYRDKKSTAQLENRARMKTIMAFLSKAKEFVNHNLDHLTKHESATNKATSMNYYKVRFGERVIEGGRNGGKIVADYKNSSPIYDELVLSQGERFGLDGAVALLQEGRLMLSWRDFACEGRSMSSDKVKVFVYNASRHQSITKIDVANRSDEEIGLALPDRWDEEELHVWVSVSDRWEREFSESQYFEFENRNSEPEGREGTKEVDPAIDKSAIKALYGCYQSAVEAGVKEEGVEAFALTGRKEWCANETQGGCPGLGDDALSGRRLTPMG